MPRGCPRPNGPRKPLFLDFPPVGVRSAKTQHVKKMRNFGEKILGSSLVGGRFTRTARKTGKIHFFGVFGPFQAAGGRKVPPDPEKSSQSGIAAAGGRTIESAKCKKLRNANTVPMGQDKTRKLPRTGGAESRPKRRPAGNIWFDPGPGGNVWFNPGSNPGLQPPWVWDRPPKIANWRKTGQTPPTSST